ncbi:RNA pseudouridine synthase [Amylibacter kogurei]|uniref:Pseudouridine synthase n=1 Tax=Paramylibacter kogurei TaxID=1889778 RepID=A0A2G5K6T1_9RHOB|nr:RluA family pseudouridine synthase [Amylibacter kogurei]PIB24414.1 RNA pseudouridine synthase [Amylibacter kogurei]
MVDLSDDILVLTVTETPPPRLDKALAEVVPEGVALSRSRLGKLIETGGVRDGDGNVIDVLKYKASALQEFQVQLPAPENYEAAQPENIPLDIVYEDDHLIVVNKAADMVVHPAPGSPNGTLVNALLHHCGDNLQGVGGEKRPGIVHRIDKGTSGILVVAKTDAALNGLAAQFADHSIDRRYQAIAIGVPSKSDPRLAGISGVGFEDGGVVRIATNIARHKTDRKRMAVTAHSGRHAITRLTVLERFGDPDRPNASLLECRLETGRTHQIRVHMSHIGHGLVGDPIYGRRRKLATSGYSPQDAVFIDSFPRQCLHARSLGFIHPETQEYMEFAAEMPADMQRIREILLS